jgi:hypothetical protein
VFFANRRDIAMDQSSNTRNIDQAAPLNPGYWDRDTLGALSPVELHALNASDGNGKPATALATAAH